jgi:hypothetical protein
VTDFWYNEEKNYSYTGKFSSSAGHFTQVNNFLSLTKGISLNKIKRVFKIHYSIFKIVWKNTQKVGFAFAMTDDDHFYVVVNYFPAGNIKNEFNENVLRPGKEFSIKVKEQPLARSVIDKNPEEDRNSRTASVSSSLSGFDQMQSRFIQEALQTHNSCRRRHCVDPV